jgi:hypothetical protein
MASRLAEMSPREALNCARASFRAISCAAFVKFCFCCNSGWMVPAGGNVIESGGGCQRGNWGMVKNRSMLEMKNGRVGKFLCF